MLEEIQYYIKSQNPPLDNVPWKDLKDTPSMNAVRNSEKGISVFEQLGGGSFFRSGMKVNDAM